MFLFRTLSVALLVLGLAGVTATLPTPAAAQSTRAYAPENLRPLSVSDRVRVLELEYAEQSGGRQLPDDQLEFYLDQIDSGWGFSRIQQDIATSLRGGSSSSMGRMCRQTHREAVLAGRVLYRKTSPILMD